MLKISEQSKSELLETAMYLDEEVDTLVENIMSETASEDELRLMWDTLLCDELGLVKRNQELQGLYEYLTLKINKNKVVFH